MVQAQERVKTYVLGGIRRGLLREVIFRLDFEGFHIVVKKT